MEESGSIQQQQVSNKGQQQPTKELLQQKPKDVKGFDFLDYGQEEEEEEDYGQEEWDLDMDENTDIV